MAIGKIDSENLGERERGGECGWWLSAALTADKVDIGVLERALLLAFIWRCRCPSWRRVDRL